MRFALVMMVGCSAPYAPPPREAPRPEPVVVEWQVTGPIAESTGEPVTLDQPPAIKLKLGHYRSANGIGLVIDRTQPEAKIRFDHTQEILRLDPVPASFGRIDYVRSAHHVVLQWEEGRVVVYVPGGDGTEVEVWRDGDATPL